MCLNRSIVLFTSEYDEVNILMWFVLLAMQSLFSLILVTNEDYNPNKFIEQKQLPHNILFLLARLFYFAPVLVF
jgi:hypothetical protein